MLKILLPIFVLFSFLSAYSEILIDLSQQKAYAIKNGEILFEGHISSGKKGHETPVGDYKILQKKRTHISNLWPKPKGGAKMPYMLRLSNSGIAMHLGYVPLKPVSHGCVRMKSGFAQKMYRWAKVGMPVYIQGDANYYLEDLEYQQMYSYEGDFYQDGYYYDDFYDR